MKDLPDRLISLDIFGEAQDIKYFENCINLTKSKSNVRWRGVIESELVVQELKKYDLLCLPSTTCEMAPLVIQEAFAAGLPVLASNVQGNAEQIIMGVNGWLFNYNDSNSLNVILQDIIESPEKIDLIKKNISMPLSFAEVAKEHNLLYNKIISI
jgi:glycosyltransferase involved in cell wall biosynthesis